MLLIGREYVTDMTTQRGRLSYLYREKFQNKHTILEFTEPELEMQYRLSTAERYAGTIVTFFKRIAHITCFLILAIVLISTLTDKNTILRERSGPKPEAHLSSSPLAAVVLVPTVGAPVLSVLTVGVLPALGSGVGSSVVGAGVG